MQQHIASRRDRAELAELAQRQAALPPAAGIQLGAEARLVRVLQQIIVPEMPARLGG